MSIYNKNRGVITLYNNINLNKIDKISIGECWTKYNCNIVAKRLLINSRYKYWGPKTLVN